MQLLPEEQEIRAQRLSAYKALAYKYGIAMIVLVLNNYAAPFIFYFLILMPAGAAGVGPESAPGFYYTLLMLINELSAYVIPVLVLRAMFSRERGEFVPDRTYSRIPCESVLLFLAGVAAGSAGTVITETVNFFIDKIFHTGKIRDVFTGMTPDDSYQLGVFMVCICVIAPVCEEYIFRDLLLKPLRCFSDMAAAVFTGLVFGLYHANFDQFAYAALLGLFYSMIAVRSNSIMPSILLHAANNLLVCLSSYLPESSSISGVSEVFSVVLSLMLPAGVIALILLAAKKCLSLHSHDRFITGGEAAGKLFLSPAVITGTAVMLAAFFV